MATTNTNPSNDDAQSSLDVVLRLLSSLTLSHDDAQSVIDVITDQIQAAALPAVQPAPTVVVAVVAPPTPTVQAATLPAVQPAPTVVVPVVAPPTPTVQAATCPAVQPAPAVIVQAAALPAVENYPTPTARSGFYGFPHLPLTEVVINGETRGQQHYRGFAFDVPRAAALGPFYLITRGSRVGVFETWQRTSPYVLGVSCSSFSRCKSLYDGLIRMLDAIDLGEAQWLP